LWRVVHILAPVSSISIRRLLKFNATLLTIVSVIAVECVASVLRWLVRWSCSVLVLIVVVSTVVGWSIVSNWSLARHPACAVSWLNATAATTPAVDTSIAAVSLKARC
jgi:hypothetical protein